MKQIHKRKKNKGLKTLFVIIIGVFVLFSIVSFKDYWEKMGVFQTNASDSFKPIAKKTLTKAPKNLPWNLTLVDSHHPINSNSTLDLMTINNSYKIDKRIYPELQAMFNQARAEGVYPLVSSAYRTPEEQEQLYNDKLASFISQGATKKESISLTETWVQKPNMSEHQLGLALDINGDLSQCSNELVYQWLENNSYKYGFVLRYPGDKIDLTGINFEPWHFRYVGKEAALEMYEKNLCLEEYLNTK